MAFVFFFTFVYLFLCILIPLLIVNSLPASISEDDDTEGRRSVDLEASPRTRNGGYQLLSEDHVS